MLDGFVTAYRDGGWVPRWSGPGYVDSMVGTHSDIVFADAYLRGVLDFDIHGAYESMLKNALVYSDDGARGRKGNQRSIFAGYVAADLLTESASWTMEDAINDFGIAQMANVLDDKTHAEYFLNRSRRFSNLFSPSVGFFRGRNANGTWRTSDADFNAAQWGYEFAEGDPWQYSAAATTDPRGMINLYGGKSAFVNRLDSVFSASTDFDPGSYGVVPHEMVEAYALNQGQYAHCNEPDHSLIYMYDYANAPSETQWRIRNILDIAYDSGIGTGRGYIGDEDTGQMSAWYVFGALGFYPASPGHAEYALGSPLFTRAVIHLDSGKQFVVSAPNNGHGNVFIQGARLNGTSYSRAYLRHSDIVAGGELELTMGPARSTWGAQDEDLPQSATPVTSPEIPAMRVDRAVDGFISASSENVAAGMGMAQAFDDDSGTQWQAQGTAPFIQYAFPANLKYSVSLYTVTSAADSPDFDPRDWELQASDDCTSGTATWVTVDRRVEQDFAWRRFTRVFSADNHQPYACYRLAISRNHGGEVTEVAEVELIGDRP